MFRHELEHGGAGGCEAAQQETDGETVFEEFGGAE